MISNGTIVTMSESPACLLSSYKPVTTPKYLYDMGMCLCDTCGKLHCVKYSYCTDCIRPIVTYIVPGEKPEDCQIVEGVKKFKLSINK